MPTGDIIALSDDDAPVLPAAPAGGSGKVAAAAELDDDDAPLAAAPAGKVAAAKKAKAKASAKASESAAKAAAKPAAAKSKAKSNPKSKAKASKELVKEPTEPEKDEPVEGEDTTEEPAPRKRPAAKSKPVDEEATQKKPAAKTFKRPAAKSESEEIRAYKYQYHDKKKWGIRIKGGSELITVRGPKRFSLDCFFLRKSLVITSWISSSIVLSTWSFCWLGGQAQRACYGRAADGRCSP